MMKQLQKVFFALLLLTVTTTWGQLLTWDASTTGGGFGPSPWSPATQNANITTSGLIRGSSILTGGSAAGGAWGGSGGWSAGTGATTDDNSFHFTVTAATGYKVSLSELTTATRRSNSGPTGYTLYYSVGGGAFASAGSATTTSTSGTTGTAGTISLSGIAALQDVPAGTVIKFRINPTGSTGNYYLTGSSNALRLNGTVALNTPTAPVATAATDVTAAGFTANWNAVTGATGYRLDVSSDAAFAQILEDYDDMAVAGLSQYVSSGIQPNTTYYYRVRAEIAAQTSPNSNIINVTTDVGCLTPPPVTFYEQLFCGAGTVAQLEVEEGVNLNWYLEETGGTPLAPDTPLVTGNYYVSQTDNGCESIRSFTEVSITPIPGAPVVAPVTVCDGATFADIATGGLDLKWYAGQTGGTAFDATDAVTAGTYYATQTVGGCESDDRTEVVIAVTVTPVPVAAPLSFCGPATVGGLTATGDALQWYADATGGMPLMATDAIVTGNYYVSQTQNGCESARAMVEVTVNAIPDAPLADAQTFCGATTVADLLPMGTDYMWYADETGGIALDMAADVMTGNYYVSQTVNGCESARTTVAVTVNAIPDAPIAEAQSFCGATTVADLLPMGTDYIWYADETGGTALDMTADVMTGNYYVSQTVNGCESARTMVEVTVNAIPDAPIAEAQSFCGATTVADLLPMGTEYSWYADETGGTALDMAADVMTGNYYVSQTVNGCESARTMVAVTVNAIPDAPIAEAQSFCGATTVAELMPMGADYNWYADETGGTALDMTTDVTTGNYYVSQTVNGCESARTMVEVTVNAIPDAPLADAQTFCGAITVADLMPMGTEYTWYADETGGTSLDMTADVITGNYYVSQTQNGCESERTMVEVTVNAIPDAPLADAQTFCGATTVADLMPMGAEYMWYADETGGTALDITTDVTTGNYYVSQTVNGCESPRTMVEVTVNAIPDAPLADAQTFCGTTTVADLMPMGADYNWYADETGGTALDMTEDVTTGNYYISQTVNGCESARTMVEVTVNAIPAAPTVAETSQIFCDGATVADLSPSTSEYTWYTSADSPDALDADDMLAQGLSVYYVSQTVNGCESTSRTAVAVLVNVTAAPMVQDITFCDAATVADLDATGTGLQWYADETSVMPLEETAVLAPGTYYVTQTLNNCESPRTAVQVTITSPEMPQGSMMQEYNAGQTLADLTISGTNIIWYADEDLTDELTDDTPLTDDTTYYAVSVIGECESEALAVNVDEVLGTDEFNTASFRLYPNPVKDILTISYNETISGIVVYNLLGQPVLNKGADAATVQVDMGSLAAGTYVVSITSGSKTQAVKVIKY